MHKQSKGQQGSIGIMEVSDIESKGSTDSNQKNQHRGDQGVKIRRLSKARINRVLVIERKGIRAEITYCTN